MEFIKADYLESIAQRPLERANEFYSIHYSKLELLNNAKEVLLLSGVTKPTWHLLMDNIISNSIESKEQFLSTTRPIILVNLIRGIFIATGELVNIEDIRSILYAYEDYCQDHLELAVYEHFAIQTFAEELYKIRANRFLVEVLCLSDFVILKMCPQSLMNAQIRTIEMCITYAEQDKDSNSISAIAKYGLRLLESKSTTYQCCQNALKRLNK